MGEGAPCIGVVRYWIMFGVYVVCLDILELGDWIVGHYIGVALG